MNGPGAGSAESMGSRLFGGISRQESAAKNMFDISMGEVDEDRQRDEEVGLTAAKSELFNQRDTEQMNLPWRNSAGGTTRLMTPGNRLSLLRPSFWMAEESPIVRECKESAKTVLIVARRYWLFGIGMVLAVIAQLVEPDGRLWGGSAVWWGLFILKLRLFVTAGRAVNAFFFRFLFELSFVAEVLGGGTIVVRHAQGAPMTMIVWSALTLAFCTDEQETWMDIEEDSDWIVPSNFRSSDRFLRIIGAVAFIGASICARELAVSWTTGTIFESVQVRQRLHEVTMARRTLHKLAQGPVQKIRPSHRARSSSVVGAVANAVGMGGREFSANSTSLVSLRAPYSLGGVFGSAATLKDVQTNGKRLFRYLLVVTKGSAEASTRHTNFGYSRRTKSDDLPPNDLPFKSHTSSPGPDHNGDSNGDSKDMEDNDDLRLPSPKKAPTLAKLRQTPVRFRFEPRLESAKLREIVLQRTAQARMKDYLPILAKLFPRTPEKLSERDFLIVLERAFKDMRYMAANLQSVSAIHDIVGQLVRGLVNMLVAIITLLVVGFNLFDFVIPLLTLLVASAFAFSESLARMVTGVVFVAFTRPFEIGDNIVLKNINSNYGFQRPFIVEHLDVMSTTLRSLHNEVFQVANHVLATMFIVNHRRSKHAQIGFYLDFNIKTPQETFDQLVEACKAWVRANPHEWRSSLVTFPEIDAQAGVVKVIIYMQHHRPWQELSCVIPSRDRFTHYLAKFIRESEVLYVKPTQPIAVMGELPEAVEMAYPTPTPGHREERHQESNRQFWLGWSQASRNASHRSLSTGDPTSQRYL
uniref:Mechanosensitive ion channel MscS domain-containing protein n=1 Tax=Phaeomonas parva TaxID=124430 RepID=A0A7S1XWN1_9STRA|mmetsp:Transcript_46414/g.145235  ORF Transcript_46414/g.145235 Transcript_46414/m.145235 type:complete len:809 (+) Transcript_46414:705-3131(+)